MLCCASRVPPVEEGESLAAVTTSPTDSSPYHTRAARHGGQRAAVACRTESGHGVYLRPRDLRRRSPTHPHTWDAKSKHPRIAWVKRESKRRRSRKPRASSQEQGVRLLYVADPQTGVAPGWTRGRHVRSRCRCSMCSAIHINSRSWLRSSSTHEPSDPPLKVVS